MNVTKVNRTHFPKHASREIVGLAITSGYPLEISTVIERHSWTRRGSYCAKPESVNCAWTGEHCCGTGVIDLSNSNAEKEPNKRSLQRVNEVKLSSIVVLILCITGSFIALAISRTVFPQPVVTRTETTTVYQTETTTVGLVTQQMKCIPMAVYVGYVRVNPSPWPLTYIKVGDHIVSYAVVLNSNPSAQSQFQMILTNSTGQQFVLPLLTIAGNPPYDYNLTLTAACV